MDINMNVIKSHQETFLDEAADEIKLEEADDGDDEEEVEEYVTLGLVQKPKNSNFLLCHIFPSKAGGFPVGVNIKLAAFSTNLWDIYLCLFFVGMVRSSGPAAGEVS